MTSLSIKYIDRARQALREDATAGPIRKSELLDLLVRRRGFEASDPRDVVYALTGLIHRTREFPMVVVDYTKSWEEVYNEAAASILAIEQQNVILHFVDVSRYPVSDSLASWAPDWRFKAQDYKTLALSLMPINRDNNLDAESFVDCDMYPEQGIIACRGDRKCDVVRYVSTILDPRL